MPYTSLNPYIQHHQQPQTDYFQQNQNHIILNVIHYQTEGDYKNQNKHCTAGNMYGIKFWLNFKINVSFKQRGQMHAMSKKQQHM